MLGVDEPADWPVMQMTMRRKPKWHRCLSPLSDLVTKAMTQACHHDVMTTWYVCVQWCKSNGLSSCRVSNSHSLPAQYWAQDSQHWPNIEPAIDDCWGRLVLCVSDWFLEMVRQTRSLDNFRHNIKSEMWLNDSPATPPTLWRCCHNVGANVVGMFVPTMWQCSHVDTFERTSNVVWMSRQCCMNIVPTVYFDQNPNVVTTWPM